MKIGIFFSDGLIGNITLNKIIPQMIEMGIIPVLFKSHRSRVVGAKISEIDTLFYFETELLTKVVEPTLKSLPMLPMNGKKEIFYTTQQLIQKYNLEYKYIENVNDPEFIDYIKSDKSVDGAISIRFYPKFEKNIINAFKIKGFMWNLHTGLLPKYKGVFIPYHSIENNEKYFGWTLHEVDYEIDTGNIIALDKLPLYKENPILNTYLGMTDKGSAMVMGALYFYLKHGFIKSKPQITDLDSYYTYPSSEDMKKWAHQGIIYTDNIIKTYTSLFTASGTIQEAVLENKLLHTLEGVNKTENYKVA